MSKQKAGGPLTDRQLGGLADASLRSALVLITDAQALLQLGSAPHAYATAILAGEEFGKCQQAIGAIGHAQTKPEYWKAYWATFYSHGPKLGRAARTAAQWLPADMVDSFIAVLTPALQQQRREVGLYVDVKDGSVVTPGDAIGVAEATSAVELFTEVIIGYAGLFSGTTLADAFAAATAPAQRMRAALESRDDATIRRVWLETTGRPLPEAQLDLIVDRQSVPD